MRRLRARSPAWGWAAFAAGIAVLAGCSENRLLTKQDYRPSVEALSDGSASEARERFPKGEDGTFITAVEKTYLDLLQGKADLAGLQKYRDLADSRFRYVVSREVRSMFYMSTPEGYYASEHEIIWMHMLLSWGYSLRKQYENACAEARQASYLLQEPWSANGQFDEPTIRVILAALWSLCGSWEDAQVMLRAAAYLDPSIKWAQGLAERDRPPRNLVLVLGGVGPDPYWDPSVDLNPLRGARHLGFKPQGRRDPLFAITTDPRLEFFLSPGSLPWYQRHLVRDNEIHDLIGDTHYALNATGEAGLYAATTAAGAAVWISWTALGIGGGYLTAVACAHSSCGEGVVGIIAWPILGFTKGKSEYDKIEAKGRQRLAEQTDPANFYRFVRFLPEYAWMLWSDASFGDSVDLSMGPNDAPVKVGTLTATGARPGAPRVFLGFLPDVFSPPAVPPKPDTTGY